MYLLVSTVSDKYFLLKSLPLNGDVTGELIKSDALADFLVAKQIIDVTSLLPLWLSMHGWIYGLNGIKLVGSCKRNFMDAISFPPPTQILPRLSDKDIAERARCQIRQRKNVITALHLFDKDQDCFEMLTWINEGRPNPWCNSYDRIELPTSYHNLYNMTVKKVVFRRTISEGRSPIHKQLAFPAKTIRCSSINIPRQKIQNPG